MSLSTTGKRFFIIFSLIVHSLSATDAADAGPTAVSVEPKVIKLDVGDAHREIMTQIKADLRECERHYDMFLLKKNISFFCTYADKLVSGTKLLEGDRSPVDAAEWVDQLAQWAEGEVLAHKAGRRLLATNFSHVTARSGVSTVYGQLQTVFEKVARGVAHLKNSVARSVENKENIVARWAYCQLGWLEKLAPDCGVTDLRTGVAVNPELAALLESQIAADREKVLSIYKSLSEGMSPQKLSSECPDLDTCAGLVPALQKERSAFYTQICTNVCELVSVSEELQRCIQQREVGAPACDLSRRFGILLAQLEALAKQRLRVWIVRCLAVERDSSDAVAQLYAKSKAEHQEFYQKIAANIKSLRSAVNECVEQCGKVADKEPLVQITTFFTALIFDVVMVPYRIAQHQLALMPSGVSDDTVMGEREAVSFSASAHELSNVTALLAASTVSELSQHVGIFISRLSQRIEHLRSADGAICQKIMNEQREVFAVLTRQLLKLEEGLTAEQRKQLVDALGNWSVDKLDHVFVRRDDEEAVVLNRAIAFTLCREIVSSIQVFFQAQVPVTDTVGACIDSCLHVVALLQEKLSKVILSCVETRFDLPAASFAEQVKEYASTQGKMTQKEIDAFVGEQAPFYELWSMVSARKGRAKNRRAKMAAIIKQVIKEPLERLCHEFAAAISAQDGSLRERVTAFGAVHVKLCADDLDRMRYSAQRSDKPFTCTLRGDLSPDDMRLPPCRFLSRSTHLVWEFRQMFLAELDALVKMEDFTPDDAFALCAEMISRCEYVLQTCQERPSPVIMDLKKRFDEGGISEKSAVNMAEVTQISLKKVCFQLLMASWHTQRTEFMSGRRVGTVAYSRVHGLAALKAKEGAVWVTNTAVLLREITLSQQRRLDSFFQLFYAMAGQCSERVHATCRGVSPAQVIVPKGLKEIIDQAGALLAHIERDLADTKSYFAEALGDRAAMDSKATRSFLYDDLLPIIAGASYDDLRAQYHYIPEDVFQSVVYSKIVSLMTVWDAVFAQLQKFLRAGQLQSGATFQDAISKLQAIASVIVDFSTQAARQVADREKTSLYRLQGDFGMEKLFSDKPTSVGMQSVHSFVNGCSHDQLLFLGREALDVYLSQAQSVLRELRSDKRMRLVLGSLGQLVAQAQLVSDNFVAAAKKYENAVMLCDVVHGEVCRNGQLSAGLLFHFLDKNAMDRLKNILTSRECLPGVAKAVMAQWYALVARKFLTTFRPFTAQRSCKVERQIVITVVQEYIAHLNKVKAMVMPLLYTDQVSMQKKHVSLLRWGNAAHMVGLYRSMKHGDKEENITAAMINSLVRRVITTDPARRSEQVAAIKKMLRHTYYNRVVRYGAREAKGDVRVVTLEGCQYYVDNLKALHGRMRASLNACMCDWAGYFSPVSQQEASVDEISAQLAVSLCSLLLTWMKMTEEKIARITNEGHSSEQVVLAWINFFACREDAFFQSATVSVAPVDDGEVPAVGCVRSSSPGVNQSSRALAGYKKELRKKFREQLGQRCLNIAPFLKGGLPVALDYAVTPDGEGITLREAELFVAKVARLPLSEVSSLFVLTDSRKDFSERLVGKVIDGHRFAPSYIKRLSRCATQEERQALVREMQEVWGMCDFIWNRLYEQGVVKDKNEPGLDNLLGVLLSERAKTRER